MGERSFWTAPAEHSDDGAFELGAGVNTRNVRPKSGVALRLPPHSKTWRDFGWFITKFIRAHRPAG